MGIQSFPSLTSVRTPAVYSERMMATHAFPAPPDLSGLLKFFATLSYDQQKHPVTQQPSTRRRRDGTDHAELQSNRHRHSSAPFPPPSQRQRTRENRVATSQDSKKRATSDVRRTQLSISHRRRESPPKDLPPPPSRSSSNDWNGSTQIPIATAKPLKHQILDRTYQPPAPVVVDASGASHLIKRLSKTTVSSRLKHHQGDDETAALEAATAALAGAFERRNHHHHHYSKTSKHHDGLSGGGKLTDNGLSPSLSPPPDSRTRDGVQTLLMYRREVEKRLSMDPTHFPAAPLGDH